MSCKVFMNKECQFTVSCTKHSSVRLKNRSPECSEILLGSRTATEDSLVFVYGSFQVPNMYNGLNCNGDIRSSAPALEILSFLQHLPHRYRRPERKEH
eukprot:IDg14905t1